VLDRDDRDAARGVIDLVDDPKVTPSGAVLASELESKTMTHSRRVLGKGTVNELDAGGRRLLG
jgi:hypothetical protein